MATPIWIQAFISFDGFLPPPVQNTASLTEIILTIFQTENSKIMLSNKT
jgi:hypothetical protein